MYRSAFDKFYWGFFFILIDFRLNGFDIIPDIIGFILFAIGFNMLVDSSQYFMKARNFNIPMILLSIFSIYEKPAQGNGIQLGQFGLLGVLLGIVAMILCLVVVYNLFMGVKDLAGSKGQMDIYSEAQSNWRQFLFIQFAAIFGFFLIFIPMLALAYIIVMLILSIIITFSIVRFMKKCGELL